MKFNIKYKNTSGYTQNTKITARTSEEAIKKFRNQHRGATLLNVYAEQKTTTSKRSSQNKSLISGFNALSPEEKKKIFKSLLSGFIVIFSIGAIFFMGIIAYFLIDDLIYEFETKYLIYSVLLILGIALVIFLNVLYFIRKKRKNRIK